MTAKLHVFRDTDNLFRRCAAHILQLARDALQQQDYFHIALAGGDTPRALYHELSKHGEKAFPYWDRIRFYFGDERQVPSDHPESNFRMVNETLFQPLGIAESAFHRIHGELPPKEAVSHYHGKLQAVPQENGTPCFDLVLLGMGADGHIASLFPGTPLLDEQTQHVGASFVDRLECWRYSLTLPVLNNARHIILLVSGIKRPTLCATSCMVSPPPNRCRWNCSTATRWSGIWTRMLPASLMRNTRTEGNDV